MLSRDYRAADLDATDRCMLDFVAKLTRYPATMDQADVEALREVGFDDRGIHDIVLVTGYFAFVNRVADGLGVQLEVNRQENGS